MVVPESQLKPMPGKAAPNLASLAGDHDVSGCGECERAAIGTLALHRANHRGIHRHQADDGYMQGTGEGFDDVGKFAALAGHQADIARQG